MHRPVKVTHNSFIGGSHTTKIQPLVPVGGIRALDLRVIRGETNQAHSLKTRLPRFKSKVFLPQLYYRVMIWNITANTYKLMLVMKH